MKIKRLIAVSFASLAISIVFIGQSAHAQTRVAIVDVGAIFKQHPTFAGQLQTLKQEADGFKASAVQAKQGLAKEAAELKDFYSADSPDFRDSQTKLAQKAAKLQVDQNAILKGLMEREAKLHFQTYQQVNRLIAQYCDSKNIQLVLRYNSQGMDPNVPGSVMQRVNSSVVYHNPANDITEIILAQLRTSVAQGSHRVASRNSLCSKIA